MYGLFYLGYMAFAGIESLMLGTAAVNALRKREERHIQEMADANIAGYWTGFSQTFPYAYRQGEEAMLQICQALAAESIDMVEADAETQMAFNQLLQSWPQYALTPQQANPAESGFPTCTSGMF